MSLSPTNPRRNRPSAPDAHQGLNWRMECISPEHNEALQRYSELFRAIDTAQPKGRAFLPRQVILHADTDGKNHTLSLGNLTGLPLNELYVVDHPHLAKGEGLLVVHLASLPEKAKEVVTQLNPQLLSESGCLKLNSANSLWIARGRNVALELLELKSYESLIQEIAQFPAAAITLPSSPNTPHGTILDMLLRSGLGDEDLRKSSKIALSKIPLNELHTSQTDQTYHVIVNPRTNSGLIAIPDATFRDVMGKIHAFEVQRVLHGKLSELFITLVRGCGMRGGNHFKLWYGGEWEQNFTTALDFGSHIVIGEESAEKAPPVPSRQFTESLRNLPKE